jgi:flagellar motor switch/type III secretory pathway protein FliN
MTPKFSAYPWDAVPRLSRREASMHSVLARWIGARGDAGSLGGDGSRASRLATLVGAKPSDVRARIGIARDDIDPHAAACTVRVGDAEIDVFGSSGGVRAIAQRLLGGPEELAAPRPLGVVEQSIWSLVVATALEDLNVAGQVWPIVDGGRRERERAHARARGLDSADAGARAGAGIVEPARNRGASLDVQIGDTAITAWFDIPDDLPLRVPPAGRLPTWADRFALDLPIVIGRCAIHGDDLARLAPRQLVTLEPPTTDSERRTTDSERRRFRAPGDVRADLDVLGGAIGLRASLGAVVAEVATGYIPRDMALPDDAHVELSVAVGTTQMSLRQLLDLSVGQIVTLGRPLAGPFEVRAQGRVLGRGELVDVDGELAVRILSLGD